MRHLAGEWRKTACSPLKWRQSPDQANLKRGEAQGCFGEADGFPGRVYVKPLNQGNESTHCRAAKEKIAADLAHDLGLPIPPVQLTSLSVGGGDIPVALSLFLYPAQYSWGQVKAAAVPNSPLELALLKTYSTCSPMLAFDTWVDQVDHNDHNENIVWGYDPKAPHESEVLFLDYSFSLGYGDRWVNQNWKNVTIAPFPPDLIRCMNRDLLEKTVRKIEGFPEDAIKEIVTRVPVSHLNQGAKDVIQEGLIGRRKILAGALKQYLP